MTEKLLNRFIVRFIFLYIVCYIYVVGIYCIPIYVVSLEYFSVGEILSISQPVMFISE